MRVVVSAGGTGGHIYPALAIIDKIKEMDKNSEILYIGTTDRMEATIVPKTGINYIGIEMKGLNRKAILKNFKVLSIYLKAKKKIKKVLLDFKPDIVLGVGGYITLPVIEVATKLKIKTFIHEQNSIPGLSNKICVSIAQINWWTQKKSDIYKMVINYGQGNRQLVVNMPSVVEEGAENFPVSANSVIKACSNDDNNDIMWIFY